MLMDSWKNLKLNPLTKLKVELFSPFTNHIVGDTRMYIDFSKAMKSCTCNERDKWRTMFRLATSDTFISSLPYSSLLCFPSGLVLNSAVLSSTARPAVTEELVPPVKVVLSVLNVSFFFYQWTRDQRVQETLVAGCHSECAQLSNFRSRKQFCYREVECVFFHYRSFIGLD